MWFDWVISYVGLSDVKKCTQHFVTNYCQEERLCSASTSLSSHSFSTPSISKSFLTPMGDLQGIFFYALSVYCISFAPIAMWCGTVPMAPVSHLLSSSLGVNKSTCFSCWESCYISYFLFIYNWYRWKWLKSELVCLPFILPILSNNCWLLLGVAGSVGHL